MRRYWILTLALARMYLRNRMTLFWNLVFPVFLLGIYSLVFSRQDVDGLNYMAWVLPGVLVLNILSFGLMSSSSAMVRGIRVLMNRRAANAFKAPEFAKDPTDGSAFRPHRVNPKNGMYRGRQVLNVEV